MTDLSTKPEAIADVLSEEIIRGDIAQGARLAQDHIVTRFNCSHVPVCEDSAQSFHAGWRDAWQSTTPKDYVAILQAMERREEKLHRRSSGGTSHADDLGRSCQ